MSANMSVYSARTGLSSILKTYSTVEREKAKAAVINKVRFEMPKEHGVAGAIEAVLNYNDYMIYNEFVSFLKESSLTDADFERVISEARESINLLTPKFSTLVEALISLDWQDRSEILIKNYIEFYVDLLVAHTKYVHFGISHLISYWIPQDKDEENWPKGVPSAAASKRLEIVHQVIRRLMTIMPMSFDVVLETIEKSFPYYKKPPHVIGGYVHNILTMMKYKLISCNFSIHLLFRKLLELDANAPRADIEDAEYEDEEMDDGGEEMFQIDMENEKAAEQTMKLPVAETLDICLEKLFCFIETLAKESSRSSNSTNSSTKNNVLNTNSCFNLLLSAFEDIILPSHNTHHVQFLLFYLCSLKNILAEKFLSNMWSKVINPNVSAPIRQSAVGYIASFLARAKFVSKDTIQNYLSEMSTWVHQYIQRSDSVQSNCSLKANLVFFSVCQAIFYVIAFRSRDLTHDKKGLLFLQSLQLSAIVGCTFNPLRVCLPAVATAFAGVTRAYQLAYCHAILERNARRKLATVYANEISTPEECLETFFPFDPYLLKKSTRFITPIYLQYQASEAEECDPHQSESPRRKRKDSVMSHMASDDVDDFLADKKQRLCDISKSYEKEMQFTYGLSPGFHV
ncbi:unnamed protein product [Hermetia illucens]|uniref:RNA polymerase I-specific transcription initiation factor RRN3 n=2 Tax=Hermetia illucens TaxID=343691 RepID=A0A7R8US00_HERIL|nr:unnamed protein product [Hermetia illucens]